MNQTTQTTNAPETDTLDQLDALLDDLSPSNARGGDIKGGPGSGWCSHCGIIYSNHNESMALDASPDFDVGS